MYVTLRHKRYTCPLVMSNKELIFFLNHRAPIDCDKYGYDNNVNVKKIGMAC